MFSVVHIAVRIAERVGDQVGLGNELNNLGGIYNRQNRTAQALDFLQKSLVIFEALGQAGKKGKAHSLHNIGLIYRNQRRFELAVECYEKSLALSEEVEDRSLTARILNTGRDLC